MAASLLHPLILLAVVCGAAAGGVLRHFVTRLAMRGLGDGLPWGTLLVNLSGAALAGLMGGFWYQGLGGAVGLAGALFLVGLLGSYTTVSALSLQTLELLHERKTRLAVGYVLLSLGLGLPLTGLGFVLAGGLSG
jgi:CrcB protein